jgi:hypothetical protein
MAGSIRQRSTGIPDLSGASTAGKSTLRHSTFGGLPAGRFWLRNEESRRSFGLQAAGQKQILGA